MKRLIQSLVVSLFLLSCDRTKIPETVRVTFQIQAPSSASVLDGPPAQSTGFDCFAFNVVGAGIASLDPEETEAVVKNRLPSILDDGSHCTYPGTTSTQVAVGSSVSLSLSVPTGKRRLIQVIGIQSPSGCTADTLGRLMVKARDASTLPSGVGGFYEVGRTIVDLSQDVTIPITNTYSAVASKNVRLCVDGSQLNEVSISPASFTIHAEAKKTLTVTGGSEPYTFTVVSGKSTIDSNGVLTASNGGTDSADTVVRATDAFGNSGERSISVFDPRLIGNSALKIWLVPDQYYSVADGVELSADPSLKSWENKKAGGTQANYLTHSISSVNYRSGSTGPNGHPYLTFSGSNISATATNGLGTAINLMTFVVARQISGFLYCLSQASSCNAAGTDFLSTKIVSNLGTFQGGGGGIFSISVAAAANTWALYLAEYKFGAPTSTAAIRIAGSSAGASLTGAPLNLGGYFYLGNNGAPDPFNGDIAEMLVYNSSTGLTSAEKLQIAHYLQVKYGL